MSTATERIMRERGDFTCFHEPFMYLYYAGDAKKEMPHFDIPEGPPTEYNDIRQMLLDAAEEGPVFFKDMSYYILDPLQSDPVFTSRITHTFLIRDPAKSIVSYHKLDPGLTSEEIGLEAQFNHCNWLKTAFGQAPVVIEAADIQTDPSGLIQAYCQAIGIEFLPHALDWNKNTPDEWKAVSGWHGNVMKSSGIRSDDKKDQAAWETLKNNPHLQALYDHHLPFYEKLQEQKLKPVTINPS